MIDREVMPPADRGEHRRDDVFRDIVDPLAARAHEMVVMLGIARDVRGDMSVALETAGHPVLDLLLEGAIDGRSADRRVGLSDAFEQLLRGERPFRGSQRLRYDEPLGRASPAPRCKAGIDRCGAHTLRIDAEHAI